MIQAEKPVVCQVLHSLNVGGAEVLAREFALHANGEFTMVFACLDSIGEIGRELTAAGYLVQLIGRRSGFDYSAARGLHRFCRKHRVSVIHAHQYTPFFYSAVSRFPAGGPRIIFTEHGRTFPDYRRPKRVLANRWLLRKQDRVVAVGDNVRHALISYEGLAANRIQVIYNGIDVDASNDATATNRVAVRRELQLAADDVAVFQVARLNTLKNHATAIRAMAALRERHPNVHLFIVGDGEERASVEHLIATEGVGHTVRLLGTRQDVSRLLSAADVCLLTSISEGIPLALIEGMAAALPCVATDVGGVAEVVVHGRTGLLAPAREHDAIARHLSKLADQPEMRHEMGRTGRARAVELFSDRQMHAAYHRLYRELAS